MIEEIIERLAKSTGNKVKQRRVVINTGLVSAHAFVTFHGEKKQKFFVKMARSNISSKRIYCEIEILGKLQNMKIDHIVEIVTSGEVDGRAFFVENFVGKSTKSQIPLSDDEKLTKMLLWLKTFYSQTRSGTVEPKELVQRIEKFHDRLGDFVDISDAIELLEKTMPCVKIPAVCRHGDFADSNLNLSNGGNLIFNDSGIFAIDFSFARFNEPPSEPFALVSPAVLDRNAISLDVLSVFDGVDPFFFAMYENLIRLSEQIRTLFELESELLVIDRRRYFVKGFPPQVQIDNIKELGLLYHERVRSS